MMSLIENKGVKHFEELSHDTKTQIQYVYDVIRSDPVYKVGEGCKASYVMLVAAISVFCLRFYP